METNKADSKINNQSSNLDRDQWQEVQDLLEELDEKPFLRDEKLDQETLALLDQIPNIDYGEDVPPFSEEMIFSWVAPERVFRPRLSKDYLRNLILLLILIGLLLIFTKQFYLLVVILSLIFLAYVLVNVPPRKVRHTISNYGIYSHERFFPWTQRGQRFWFEQEKDKTKLFVETKIFPYRLIMLVDPNKEQETISYILKKYLVEQKPAPTEIDKIISWWQEKFPME